MLYETRFKAASNGLLGMCVHLFHWSVQTQSSMAAPVKITAFKEASIAIEREATFIRQAPLSSRAVLVCYPPEPPFLIFLTFHFLTSS